MYTSVYTDRRLEINLSPDILEKSLATTLMWKFRFSSRCGLELHFDYSWQPVCAEGWWGGQETLGYCAETKIITLSEP